MLLQDKQIAIIGGGPGGLALARLFQQEGVNVKVYERDVDQHVRQQGATLDLHEDSGLKAIGAAGLMDEFKKYYRPGADKMRVVNAKMNIVFDDHAEKPEEDFGNEYFRPEIDRGPLRDILIASLHPGNIVWNSRFVNMTPEGEGWNIMFENGTNAYADLVIASDGANSSVRKYVTEITPSFSGVTAIEVSIENAATEVPKLWKLSNGGKIFALEHGQTILYSPKADGTLSFLIGMKTSENWVVESRIDFKNKADVKTWFEREFSDWDAAWGEAFDAQSVWIVPRPMYHFPVDQQWESLANLVMIGDAAHRIPPYAGEGANQALADAFDLFEALCKSDFSTMQQAISAFEQKMKSRLTEVTDVTLQMTDAMHATDNLAFLLNFFASVATPGDNNS